MELVFGEFGFQRVFKQAVVSQAALLSGIVWGGVEIWEALEGMKSMVQTAGLGEIIQRVRTKKMKDRTSVLLTLEGAEMEVSIKEICK